MTVNAFCVWVGQMVQCEEHCTLRSLFGGNPPVWHTYFEVDGERVAEATNPNGTMIHNYFHNDYQNSIGMITDDTTIQPPKQDGLSDVFGQPRLPTGATDPTWGATDVSKRRYINQEDLTDAQLIDLNARVYDPLLAKFLSPDPIISDQDDSQSWNAYAYSHNNPMSKEDPTGLDPNVNDASAASDALENKTSGAINAQISSGALIATNGHQSVIVSVAQAIKFAVCGATLSPQAESKVIQGIGDKGGPGDQALADAKKGLSELNVKLPDGSTYKPMSHVKNEVQAKLFGQKLGTPIPFMVPQGVDPEQMVDDWAGKRGRALDFASYWWPGGIHDYKQTPRIGPMLDGFGNFMYGATGAAAGYSQFDLQFVGQALKIGKNDPVNVQDIDTGIDAINRGGQLFASPSPR